jgi:hypothetical protein
LIRCRCWKISKCEADQGDRPAMIKQSLARTPVMDDDGLISLSTVATQQQMIRRSKRSVSTL